MGTPAKPKVTIRSSSKTRSTNRQTTDAESKTLSKKENDAKVLAQKPKEKVREIRQSPNKNVGILRKLNNINDVITKNNKNNKPTTKNPKLEKKSKEKIGNTSKKAINEGTDNKFSWHDILSGKNGRSEKSEKNEKQIVQKNVADISLKKSELQKEHSNSDVRKSMESVSTMIECQSVSSQESEHSKSKTVENLTEEFENIFDSLKQNASSDEKEFLDIRRQELEMIYFGIASSVLENKSPKKSRLQSANNCLKSDIESRDIVSESNDLEEEEFNEEPIKENDEMLKGYANSKAVNSLQNVMENHGKCEDVEEEEDIEVKNMSSISLLENKSIYLQFRVNENAENRNTMELKENLLRTASSRVFEEENTSEENSFVEINLDMEGFQSSDENFAQNVFETGEVQIEDDDSDSVGSIISISIEKKVQMKNNDLNVGNCAESKSKANFKDLHCNISKQEPNRFEVDEMMNDEIRQSTFTENHYQSQDDFFQKYDSKEELQGSIKSAQFEIISGFSQILFTALQSKPIYNKNDISQSEQTSLSEWTVLHEGGCQEKITNLDTEKNSTENEQQNNVVSDNEETHSNSVSIAPSPQMSSDKISNYSEANDTERETEIEEEAETAAVAEEASEENASTANTETATPTMSNREIVERILKELKGTDLSILNSDFGDDFLLPSSMMFMNDNTTLVTENILSNFRTPNENASKMNIPSNQSEIEISVSQHESLSKQSSQLSQSSSLQNDVEKALTSTIKEDYEQKVSSQVSAQNWIKEFINRMSATYEISFKEQHSTELFKLEKNMLSQSSEDDDYTLVQQYDLEAEDEVEVLSKQSDTQLLIQQLEYNIEQIRIGLTELSKACDSELQKVPRQRPRFLPMGGKKRTLAKNTETELERDAERCVCGCNLNHSNDYSSSKETIKKRIDSNELNTKKSVTWGKVENFYERSSTTGNTNEIISPNQSSTNTCNQKNQINEIELPVSMKTSEKEVYLTNEKPLNCSTDIKEKDYDKNRKIETYKTEGEIEKEEIDLQEVYKIPMCNRKVTTVQDQNRSKNADLEMPTYDGCPCMLKTYKTIVQHIQDKEHEFK